MTSRAAAPSSESIVVAENVHTGRPHLIEHPRHTGETRRHLVEHHLHRQLDIALDDLGLLLRKSDGSAIDAVDDDRVRPDRSFPDPSWRGLVPCLAIHGRERSSRAPQAPLRSDVDAFDLVERDLFL